MFATLPDNPQSFLVWHWTQIEPYYADLAARNLTASTVDQWLADWTRLKDLLEETQNRLYYATCANTADEIAQQRYQDFTENIQPKAEAADQLLKEKLLTSGLEPDGMKLSSRHMRAEAALFRKENLPLFTEEQQLGAEFMQIIGQQTVEWEGEERTVQDVLSRTEDPDRDLRKRAWRAAAERQLRDKTRLDDVWRKTLELHHQMAHNTGYASYRDFRWQQLLRFDYTPADCLAFHSAVEAAVVPAMQRWAERRCQRLGIDTLRPWDGGLGIDPAVRPPLQPFERIEDLISTASTMFHHVHPDLGGFFDTLHAEGWLDLENRKYKVMGGYEADLPASRRALILMSATGTQRDVSDLVHEMGHALHAHEYFQLPYFWQRQVPLEFAEVAAMALELLVFPYLAADAGGFYPETDANRVRVQHLERMGLMWCMAALGDAFQHWVYDHVDLAADPSVCDTEWLRLTRRFFPFLDISGFEREETMQWRTDWHFFLEPFYFIEYAFAQLGAVQIWRNAQHHQVQAFEQYRAALRLGYTVPLPDLYATADAKFAFDAATLSEVMDLIETAIEGFEE